MANAWQEARWDHTSQLIAATASTTATKPINPLACHPFYEPIDDAAAGGDGQTFTKNEIPQAAVFGLLRRTFVGTTEPTP